MQALPDQTYYDSLQTEPTANATRMLEYMRTFAYANGINTPEVDADEAQAILDAKAQEARDAYMRQIEARKESAPETDAESKQTARATASPGNKLE